MRPEEWSVVWEGIAAIGTMGAVGWAVYTTLAERRKRSVAEHELTAEKTASRVAKHREQAEHVAVWFDTYTTPSFESGGTVDLVIGAAKVGNYSSAPIFNAVVSGEAWLSEETFALGHARVVPPGSEPWSASLGRAAEYASELLLQVEFQDVAGVWWRRTSHGNLQELPGRPQT